MAKKHTKNIQHEYISIKQSNNGYLFRLSNYIVLLSMVLITVLYRFEFSEYAYLLVFSGIVGYDVPGIINLVRDLLGKKR